MRYADHFDKNKIKLTTLIHKHVCYQHNYGRKQSIRKTHVSNLWTVDEFFGHKSPLASSRFRIGMSICSTLGRLNIFKVVQHAEVWTHANFLVS
jgi:hypothetical protein